MTGHILRTARPRIRVTLALVLAVTLGLVLLFTFSSGVLAQDTDATPEATAVPAEPPLGDCYGGVLSHDPLRCYALEQAEAAEIMDVDVIYLAGARLYIYVGGETRTDRPLGFNYGYPTANAAIHRGVGEKMKEYAQLWPGRVDLNRGRLWDCRSGQSDADCLVMYVDEVPWGVESVFDPVWSYDSLFLMAGNSDTRSSITGWAGWTQLWPAAKAGGQGEPDSTRGETDESATTFDVSNVDTTNFPELDCSLVSNPDPCESWSWNVERGIDGMVGYLSTSWLYGEGTLYIQLHRDPDDLEAFEAAKAEILRLKPQEWQDQEWVIIPVKHSYPDLWKWGLILDRFAETSGNTIGILGAGVHHNARSAHGDSKLGLYRDEGAGNDWSEGEGFLDVSLVRQTVSVDTLDAYVVRDALPVLLPQLGIPVDAVGVILERRQEHLREDPAIDSSFNTSTSDTEGGDESEESTNQTGKAISTNNVDITQPDSVDADDPSEPPELSEVPEPAEGSGFPIWALTVIVAGAVALVLVSGSLVWIRLRRRTP